MPHGLLRTTEPGPGAEMALCASAGQPAAVAGHPGVPVLIDFAALACLGFGLVLELFPAAKAREV